MPEQPVLKNFHNIECRDAVLAWDRIETVPRRGRQAGHPLGRPDDEDAPGDRRGRARRDRARAGRSATSTRARPSGREADFIVGNPPFIGGKDIREELGDGYAEALWRIYREDAAIGRLRHVLVGQGGDDWCARGKAERFGFITTNSAARRSTAGSSKATWPAKDRLSIVFAIPDHPWVDAADGAAVRVAMTAGAAGTRPGKLLRVISEEAGTGMGGQFYSTRARVQFTPTCGSERMF